MEYYNYILPKNAYQNNMTLGKNGVRNIAVIVGVIAVAAVLLAVFAFPASPHFGFVSEQQTNSIMHQNLTSSQSSSSTVSNSTSGEKKAEAMDYYSGSYTVSISIVEYNSSAYASKAYSNFSQILGSSLSLSLIGVTLNNTTFKGFHITYGFVSVSLYNYNIFFAAGLDGSYLFLIYGSLSTGNSSEVAALADAQASAMV